MKVAARYFSPAPKVDSAVIVIKNISRKNFEENKIDEEKFWEIVKAGFAHKRKKLSGNLKNVFSDSNESFKLIGNKRAEDLPLAEWINLAK
jgi:16S rRNA (adenine1518-N6/adenine1519-N6)-dimethyltransferase